MILDNADALGASRNVKRNDDGPVFERIFLFTTEGALHG